MSKRQKKPKPPVPLRFKVGDHVRVKPGFRDEEHPDIPLGGWAGTVSQVHRSGMYTVQWSRETLASIHPIYKKRCVIDGTVLGGIVGLVLRRLVRGKKWLVLRIFPNGILFAATCGVTAQAFYMDRAGATTGLWYGALIGLGSGLFLCLIALPLTFIAVRRNSR